MDTPSYDDTPSHDETPCHNEVILRRELQEKNYTALDPIVQLYLDEAREFRASLSTEDERVCYEMWGSNNLRYSSASIFYTEFPRATPSEQTNLKAILLSKRGVTAILQATGNSRNGYGDWLVMAHLVAERSEQRLRAILFKVYKPLLPGVFESIKDIDHLACPVESAAIVFDASDRKDKECSFSWDDLLASDDEKDTQIPPPPMKDITAPLKSLLNSRLEKILNLH